MNSHTYTIKGIFAGKKHETYTGLSSDLSENTMFVDYNSLDTKMVTKLTIDSNHLKQVQSLYPSSEYVVSKDKKCLSIVFRIYTKYESHDSDSILFYHCVWTCCLIFSLSSVAKRSHP